VNRVKIGAETKGETRKSLIQVILKKRVIVGGDRIGMIGPFGTSHFISCIIVTCGKISVDLFGIL
jgi:rRNA processing protein Krr1/Pno1